MAQLMEQISAVNADECERLKAKLQEESVKV